MKNKLTYAFLSLFFMLSSALFAQQQEWNGQVLDSKTNEPLIGVSVVVKGTSIGTVTDIDGRFTIKAAVNQELILTYIGYASVEILLNSSANLIRILMSEDNLTLEEVVVVGYGVQKKVTSVGSISATKGEDLLKVGSVTTVSEALQGLLPGVVAINVDSKPGSDEANILIRGKGSWQSSKPLVMVDGIERDMNDIDPNEIDGISVLKDASATAVYGVKGANGVILVTTKRGSNTKPKISVTTNFGFKQPLNNPEYADNVTSMRMWNEALINDLKYDNLIPESTIAAWENAYAQGITGPYNSYFPEIDWWNEIVKTVGYQQQYNINISGGSDFMRYFASIGYLNDGDIFKTQKNELFDPVFKYQRYNWRSNFDFQLTKSTVFSVNLSGKQGYRSQPGYRINDASNQDDDKNFGQPQFFQALYNSPRNSFPIIYEDGNYGVGSAGGGNLIMQFDRGQRIYKYYQNFIDANLKQDLDFITKGLSFNAKFGFNASSDTRSDIQRYQGGNFGEKSYIAYYREYDYTKPLDNNIYALKQEVRWVDNDFQGDSPSASYDNTMNGGFGKRIYYEAGFNYNQSFNNHNLTALALVNANEVEGLKPGSSTNMQFKENDLSYVGRITYNWKERYLAEFNGNYSGSQKFAPGKRFKFFPSYSVGWRISEEPVVKKITGKTLDNLKVRYSYGTVGYDRIPGIDYAYIQSYDSGGNITLGENEKINFGPLYTEGAAANVNATWETAYKQNLGIDVMLLNKLTATVDMYSENREGILMDVSLPAYFGIRAAKANIGKTKSRGIEIELGWDDKISKDFNYWIKANFAVNENRIVFRDDAPLMDEYLKQAGKPIGHITRLQFNGYYQSLDDIYNYSQANDAATQNKLVPGDLMYLDYNCDGKIDSQDRIPMLYNNYPQKTYGGSIGFRYKQFQVNAMFYGVIDVYKDVDGSVLWDLAKGNEGNYVSNPDVIGRWTPATATTAIKPALHSEQNTRNYSMTGGTTYSFQDASYVRLKNLELSYDFKAKILKKSGIRNLQLYANANNLFTITKFNKQIDPEGNSASLYPLVRRYNIGMRISF
ncbi:MAG: TonB-dependent Receptor Plug Domain protein [Bacteroidetes bacterium ADurb.Bin174]|nr:MAG: TonB-dependent Receptor Plug Domain protein [Bacteroidetes bacterium ADurb.Bin174]